MTERETAEHEGRKAGERDRARYPFPTEFRAPYRPHSLLAAIWRKGYQAGHDAEEGKA